MPVFLPTVPTPTVGRVMADSIPTSLPRLSGRFCIYTYGCQMNEHDSEKIASLLQQMGLQAVAEPEAADVVILNTCSVREKAGQKVFSELGKLRLIKRRRPHMVIAVCGCLAQQEGERIFRQAPHVDVVFGPRNIPELPELLRRVVQGERHVISLSRPRQWPAFDQLAVYRRSPVVGYVTIMEGCDKFCTFCIVPFTRGRETYRPPRDILMEVQALAEAGYSEVVLLGQTVNSYRWEDVTFTALLRMIHNIEGIRRIRFVSPHPSDVTDELIATMRDYPKICRHIHLPLQAGSDRILQAMRRTYTQRAYLEKVEKLRKAIPDIAIGTDIIVGFPGETDEDFRETLAVVEEVAFDSAYTFIYSPRAGTEAAAMDDQVPEEVKHERLEELVALVQRVARRRNEERIGRVEEVLVEGPSRTDPSRLRGRTRRNQTVTFVGSAHPGDLVHVLVESASSTTLSGREVARVATT